jgi:folate-binding protein YgfZ
MVIDVDILQAPAAAKTLGEFVFSEDVRIEDVSATHHHVALHGRHAVDVLKIVASGDLPPGGAAVVSIAGCSVVAARRDQSGEPGIELIMSRNDAPAVWTALLASARTSESESATRVRPIGWSAFNIARVEAGTPLMNIDFGTTNLPHETSLLRKRVSFTKGCYLGQEIVARMESLGKPRQMLVGLRMAADLLPESGAQVFLIGEHGSMGEEVGVVTSSTLSPMLGAAPVAFGMLKTAAAAAGTSVLVNGEGSQSNAIVGELQFHSSTA